ncbi:response regulator transcription factor [Winogradskyella sp.]|uniref:response regulator transcription factor n=1 Tax=Winogradskyella sp. TaxID=1883156 RepID=UPI002621EF5B|nr:response regulator transcription factor [Winogradskyella sp.]
MKKVYLVEDDPNLGYILKEYLELNNFDVQLETDGQDAIANFTDADICILDLMLPVKDGFEVAKYIRSISNIPLLFLTAKSLKVDKLKAFKIGADDYLVKPVDEEELIARIRAILSRYSEVNQKIEYSIGDYAFDHSNQTLTINGDTLRLTQRESLILLELCKYQNKIVSRDAMLKKIWGDNDYFNRRSMDVFISKLRKYLSRDHSIEIKNIHGKGFILIC